MSTDETQQTPGRASDARIDPTMQKLIDATAGQYRIERELGRGGMATVYLAHDLALDRKVAIKVMASDLFAAGDVAVDRFLREARTGARLNHPHIIPVYAVRESDTLIFFVMKYIEGKPLDDVIRNAGALPIPLVTRVLAQVSDALAYAHRNGIVHRDIKPGNLMLDKEGWVVLTDLGIAKVAEAQMLTATGSAIGTPTYMSPEQSAGAKDLTGASDQYSLGCVAHEMLTGAPPFDADSVVALIFKHHTEPPPPLTKLRPDVPADVAAIIGRMMAKAPEERYASMEEVAQLFRDCTVGDEEEFRLLLRAYATGAGQTQAIQRINNTPKTPARSLTPARASTPISREVAVNTTGFVPVRNPTPTIQPSLATTPDGQPVTVGAQHWPRTMIRPADVAPKRARRFQVPSVLTLGVVGAAIWFFTFPGVSALATEVPTVTAVMKARQADAEAAVRRGQAGDKGDACNGIRRDLADCRKHQPVPLSDIAPAMVEAVLAAEDPSFGERQGADWVAIRRAAGYPRDAFEWGNAVDREDLRAVLPKVGEHIPQIAVAGSLSQRLAQTVWFPVDESLFRKSREVVVANRLAKALSKDRIIEVYLNVAEFGPGLYGVEAAAQAYFQTSAKKLTRSQAAALAATLATPRTSTPTNDPEVMRRRQALILRRMSGEAVTIPLEPAVVIGPGKKGA